VNKTYYRQAHGALLILDISSPKGKGEIKKELEKWIEGFREVRGDEVPIFLVGNKCDLKEEEEFVEGVEEFAKENNMIFWKTSAKVGTNVDLVMKSVVNAVYEKHFKGQIEDFQRIVMEKKSLCVSLTGNGQNQIDRSGCCS